MTLDEATRQPALEVALCEGETVTAVKLSATREQNGAAVATATLWKIEASIPSKRTRYVVGETPPGFVESVPLSDRPDGQLTLQVMTHGGIRDGHGEFFDPGSLRQGVLVNGTATTRAGLVRNAKENCSFLGLALPPWVGWFAAGAAGLIVLGLLLAVARTRRRGVSSSGSGIPYRRDNDVLDAAEPSLAGPGIGCLSPDQ